MLTGEQNNGTTIRDLEQGVIKVQGPMGAKVLAFPSKPVVEVSPLQVAELEQYGSAAEQMSGMTLAELDHRPEWLRKFSAPDMAIYNSFPSLSELQCECEDCMCTEHPTKWVEARWVKFKLCASCLEDCAKHVEKVVDFNGLTDEQLCNDWELRR